MGEGGVMVIACQHPIVRGLSSGSNLGTEVVGTPDYCHIEWSTELCSF